MTAVDDSDLAEGMDKKMDKKFLFDKMVAAAYN